MTHNNTLVSIDNGYWQTKLYSPPHKIQFRSKYEESDLNINNAYQLTYEGKNYLVGDGLDNIEIDKTSNKLHKITTITALALISKPGIINNFKVVAMYPLLSYNKQNKKNFEQYLKSINNINVKLNGQHYILNISDALVFPQTAGVIYTDIEKYKNKLIGIVDIGGLTTQGCIFNNLQLIRESIFTENFGMIILFDKVKKALNSQFNINLQEYELEYIINNGLRKNTEQSLSIIKNIINTHIELLIKTLRVNRWNLENLDLLFTGGGSLTLDKYLQQYFPTFQLSTNPIFDNAKGTYKVGELKFV